MTVRALLDGTLFVEEFPGGDPPLVVLHGWGRSRLDLSHLKGANRFIAFDLPGFGSSPGTAIPSGAREYAAVVASGLRQMDVSNALVFGHSFGGRVAVCLAAHCPEIVGGLVISGSPLIRNADGGKLALRYRIARLAWRNGLIKDETMERKRLQNGSDDYRQATPELRVNLVKTVNEDYTAELELITCPTAFIWGELDSAAPVAAALRAAKLIHSMCHIEVIPGAGHDVHKTHASEVKRVIQLVGQTQ